MPQLTKKMEDDLLSLEGRDLWYFILDLYENKYIEGDTLTQFLTDNIGDHKVINFMDEEVAPFRLKEKTI
jgi:hypothetical protein|tara:strand:- start:474 stop:683 length:210 start_codon:yes stop_codon:yes gene_type:complete